MRAHACGASSRHRVPYRDALRCTIAHVNWPDWLLRALAQRWPLQQSLDLIFHRPAREHAAQDTCSQQQARLCACQHRDTAVCDDVLFVCSLTIVISSSRPASSSTRGEAPPADPTLYYPLVDFPVWDDHANSQVCFIGSNRTRTRQRTLSQHARARSGMMIDTHSYACI